MYTVNEPTCVPADQVVAAVATPLVGLDDLGVLLRRLLPTAPVQALPPHPVPTEMEIMLERLLSNAGVGSAASDHNHGYRNHAAASVFRNVDVGPAGMVGGEGGRQIHDDLATCRSGTHPGWKGGQLPGSIMPPTTGLRCLTTARTKTPAWTVPPADTHDHGGILINMFVFP